MLSHIPSPARTVLEQLHNAGYAAYVVGGCVRDSLLGRIPGDWDITTAARPEQVHTALSGMTVLDTGLQHGTVTAVVDDLRLEITTFRTEGTYSDHRRPDSVTFAQTIEEDLSRRDFTVNMTSSSPEASLSALASLSFRLSFLHATGVSPKHQSLTCSGLSRYHLPGQNSAR